VDALVAYAIGFIASALVLWLLGVLKAGMSPHDWIGKVSLQAVPASIGALLAQTQLGESSAEEALETRGGVVRYESELFVMGVGALFLSFNLAPTEEMLLIALQMSGFKAVLLVLASIAAMHGFVYAVAFHGGHSRAEHESGWSLLLRYTVVGYALAALISAYMLWSFGRLEGLPLATALQNIAVLGFPAAIGAAAARLIL
jgi:putative integral membrane protein (TIGR02587 family)